MFANNVYAKVWEVQEKDNGNGGITKTIRISTSQKKEDGSYEQDFSGFVKLVGEAKDKVINNGDRIQLVRVGVKNYYDKEKKVTYNNFLCFELKTQGNTNDDNENGTSPTSTPTTPTEKSFSLADFVGEEEDELPFK